MSNIGDSATKFDLENQKHNKKTKSKDKLVGWRASPKYKDDKFITTLASGPKAKRSCTDGYWCILFILLIAGMGGVTYVA
jgi:hypothetical protein